MRATFVALGVATLSAGMLMAPPATAQTRNASTVTAPRTAAAQSRDFNGDGYQDLAVGVPKKTVDNRWTAGGAVLVTYGSAPGLNAAKRVLITQNTSGVPGAVEGDDRFGTAISSGDLNGDGYADLAVSAPGEDIDGVEDAGLVTVLYGGSSGISGRNARTFNVGFFDGTGKPRAVALGSALVFGDFNGDYWPDLAVESNTESRVYIASGRSPEVPNPIPTSQIEVPSINPSDDRDRDLAAADVNGDGKADLLGLCAYQQLWVAFGAGYPKKPDQVFQGGGGDSLAVGDVNGDGKADVAVGQPPLDTGEGRGRVAVRYGSTAGLGEPSYFDEDTPGVPGSPTDSDEVGRHIAVGDITGDGKAEIAVSNSNGVPDQGPPVAGSVIVLRGASEGATGTGAQVFAQGTAGVPDTPRAGDKFGTGVTMLDFTKDGRAELIVGSAGENNGVGAITVLKGSADGATTADAQFLKGTLFGMGIDEIDAQFGEILLH